jgi:hypothetical protein
VRALTCPDCSSLVPFESTRCLVSDTDLGYSRRDRAMLALHDGRTDDGLARCTNAGIAACNWLTTLERPLCDCCALTRTRPADGDTAALATFALTEAAKRRLLYQLDDLGLPVVGRQQDPDGGLAFDLLSSAHENVTIGHASGVVTIDLAEGDDGYREQVRIRLDEPYRTMLGHLRHETGHWYWDVHIRTTGSEVHHWSHSAPLWPITVGQPATSTAKSSTTCGSTERSTAPPCSASSMSTFTRRGTSCETSWGGRSS